MLSKTMTRPPFDGKVCTLAWFIEAISRRNGISQTTIIIIIFYKKPRHY
jgi:hypothetical protein